MFWWTSTANKIQAFGCLWKHCWVKWESSDAECLILFTHFIALFLLLLWRGYISSSLCVFDSCNPQISPRPPPLCSSICGHIVINSGDIHFYTATKYAVSALTEGLRQELREAKTHIRATVRFQCRSFRNWGWHFNALTSTHWFHRL